MAAAALEEALHSRRIDLTTPGLVLRSDNGLVFGAKAFVKVARRYGLTEESITPYTPQQNGMIERFLLQGSRSASGASAGVAMGGPAPAGVRP